MGIHLASAQFTVVPDSNFEAYLEDNGMGDGISGNSLVLTANIENVTTLTLYGNMNISDLSGIEDFTALETFYCSLNPVTQVNLSQNVNLSHVGFAASNLTTLDLSNNHKLEYAGGMHNLNLHTVTINSPFITEIEFWENSIVHIDVTQCPALERMDVHYNVNLSSLDISNNPNLKILLCGENNLNTLDTSNNLLLEFLSIGNNPNLTDLDLSQNPLLRNLSAGHNNSMTFIDIRNGNNENMDFFSTNPANNLQCVYVDDVSADYLDNWNIPDHSRFVNNEEDCGLVSVEDYDTFIFNLYPNPTQENVSIVSNVKGFYRVYSSEGKVLDSGEIDEEYHIISLSNYSSGLYYIELSSDNFKEIKKIIKN